MPDSKSSRHRTVATAEPSSSLSTTQGTNSNPSNSAGIRRHANRAPSKSEICGAVNQRSGLERGNKWFGTTSTPFRFRSCPSNLHGKSEEECAFGKVCGILTGALPVCVWDCWTTLSEAVRYESAVGVPPPPEWSWWGNSEARAAGGGNGYVWFGLAWRVHENDYQECVECRRRRRLECPFGEWVNRMRDSGSSKWNEGMVMSLSGTFISSYVYTVCIENERSF